MNKILITGASGLIGTRLTEMLLERGYQVVHLGRSKKSGPVPSFTWDVESGRMDHGALQDVGSVIHLAGAGIADKSWTPRRKKEIVESRTVSTRMLFDALKAHNPSVVNFILASAIGYYGFDDREKNFKEDDGPGKRFLAEVVKLWEAEVDRIETLGIRVVKVRVGIVLSDKAGVLPEMARPVRFFVGAPLGSGEQMLSWIHIDDLCRVFIKALEDSNLKGPVNGVGPYPVTNKELTAAIARTLRKPMIIPAVPSFVLKVLFGDMADLVLKGNSVSNEKLVNSGFTYQFDTLEKALKDLLSR